MVKTIINYYQIAIVFGLEKFIKNLAKIVCVIIFFCGIDYC